MFLTFIVKMIRHLWKTTMTNKPIDKGIKVAWNMHKQALKKSCMGGYYRCYKLAS